MITKFQDKLVRYNKGTKQVLFALIFVQLLAGCSVTGKVGKQAGQLLQDTLLQHAHAGISIYEPATNSYWYSHNADKYFVPASCTKLFTLYAALKNLGDSITGAWYRVYGDTAIAIIPNGDPSFLHPAYRQHPLLDFLKAQNKAIYMANNYKGQPLGSGWSWDDYNDAYSAEINAMPAYGNLAIFNCNSIEKGSGYYGHLKWNISPSLFKDSISDIYLLQAGRRVNREKADTAALVKTLGNFYIRRNRTSNSFILEPSAEKFTKQTIPFFTNGINTARQILRHEFNLTVRDRWIADESLQPGFSLQDKWQAIKSQPVDSVLKQMIWYSDNFTTEQLLLMIKPPARNWLSTEASINEILKNDLAEIPQKPVWADGSGTSRYNLFSPNDFVYILNKLQEEFGLERLKTIMPTGGQGTLRNYYKSDSSFIYAKTGTLSGQVSLCGYIITRKNRLLVFSVLVNNINGSAAAVRRSVASFLHEIRSRY